jgi:phosphoribosylanthranilate isomerase
MHAVRIEPGFVIKVCGITEEEDGRAALAAGANALGFNFYAKSPRYIPARRAREIARALGGSYLRVGVFVNSPLDELLAIAALVPLDVLQLHGDSCEIPGGTQYRVWRSVRGDGPVPESDSRVEAYLLDTQTPEFGGSGRTFDWSQAREFPYRAIVAGGLSAANVGDAIASLRPWGVDACSCIESRPGRKDEVRMRAFLRAALEGSELLRSQEVSFL